MQNLGGYEVSPRGPHNRGAECLAPMLRMRIDCGTCGNAEGKDCGLADADIVTNSAPIFSLRVLSLSHDSFSCSHDLFLYLVTVLSVNSSYCCGAAFFDSL